MPRYIALLRAINVGGHTVKMDHLRRLFEALDLAAVETFIASGNVVFHADEGDALYVIFVREAPGAEAIERLAALASGDDRFAIHAREVYWWRNGRMSDSAVTGAQLARAIGQPGTNRNVTTVRRLAAKYGEGG